MSVARESRLIVGGDVMQTRSWKNMQAYADELPFANRNCTDDLAVYEELLVVMASQRAGKPQQLCNLLRQE